MNNFDKNLEFWSNTLQILSFFILINDFNNNDLMQYLKHQDSLLDEIIKQNNELLEILKGDKNGYRKNNTSNS